MTKEVRRQNEEYRSCKRTCGERFAEISQIRLRWDLPPTFLKVSKAFKGFLKESKGKISNLFLFFPKRPTLRRKSRFQKIGGGSGGHGTSATIIGKSSGSKSDLIRLNPTFAFSYFFPGSVKIPKLFRTIPKAFDQSGLILSNFDRFKFFSERRNRENDEKRPVGRRRSLWKSHGRGCRVHCCGLESPRSVRGLISFSFITFSRSLLLRFIVTCS